MFHIPERYQYRMQRYHVYKDNDNCYTVWGYPHIVMWEFDNETDAKHCAEDLNKEIVND
jgi:hypothetical protein